MAKAKAISFAEFRSRYNTEQTCWEELFHLRFPEGFVCPHCGCREHSFIRTRKTFQCKKCRRQTSVTTGTVMHHTHLPLTVWFWAFYLCAMDKRGVSATYLSRILDICYESAWYLLDRIRTAMGQRDADYVLSGIIEMDAGYVGGPSHGQKRGLGTTKAKVVVALSKDEDGKPKHVHMKVVETVSGETLQRVVDDRVSANSVVECDGASYFWNLQNVDVVSKVYSAGDLHWLHKAISNLKRLLLGTYHGRCTKLQAYLDEFCFRFNRRTTGDQQFLRLARSVATSECLAA